MTGVWFLLKVTKRKTVKICEMRGTTKATVILADDHAGMIDKVAEIIGQECTIIAKVSDGIASVEAAMKLRPRYHRAGYRDAETEWNPGGSRVEKAGT